MTNLVTKQELDDYKAAGTRTIKMPDGSTKDVRMTPNHWDAVRFLKVIEDISEQDLAGFALEEVSLQNITFDEAYRACVAHLANRWT